MTRDAYGRVRCGTCAHFERDRLGDGSGIGRCREDAWRRGQPALYPDAPRQCHVWERKS